MDKNFQIIKYRQTFKNTNSFSQIQLKQNRALKDIRYLNIKQSYNPKKKNIKLHVNGRSITFNAYSLWKHKRWKDRLKLHKGKNYTKKVSLNIKEILRQAKMKNLSPPDHYRKNNVGNLTPDTRG